MGKSICRCDGRWLSQSSSSPLSLGPFRGPDGRGAVGKRTKEQSQNWSEEGGSHRSGGTRVFFGVDVCRLKKAGREIEKGPRGSSCCDNTV
ncbi:unnamed protein product [Protopolystoma xenopodis]|uniref:Uncharacterized protein n=1 Tax=Protopolystoma xenopodis TaxID=117903 RepID=A0A3S5BU33_9PLAT|nr:unnamed protein product [Protopolystoma xenopodis]